MTDRLAACEGVAPSLLATRWDYEQIRPHLSKRMARLPVSYLPNAERLLRATLISTNFLSVERWSGKVDWIYSPKEQPVATRRARLAVTVHDVLAFEREVPGLDRGFRPVTSLRWRMLMRRILRRASLIATVSEFTRQRMIELFGIRDEQRLVVVGNGVAPYYFSGRQPEDVETLACYGLTPDSYLMTIGSLTFRKSGDLLLDLAKKLSERQLPWRVVVTGRRHDEELVRRYNSLKSDDSDLPLDLPGYVSNDDQAVLLRNALVLVFPSRYEGFGIPVLEAMAAGTPVVCSRAGALTEVAGDAALFVNSDQADDWLEKILEVANVTSVREPLIEDGRRRAAEFTWERCVARLVTAMSKA